MQLGPPNRLSDFAKELSRCQATSNAWCARRVIACVTQTIPPRVAELWSVCAPTSLRRVREPPKR